MPDEPTPTAWEHQRALTDLRQDLRDGFRSLNERFDRVVSAEVFEAFRREYERRMAEVEKDVAAQAEDRKAEAKQRAADRKWLIALAVGMVAPLLMQLYGLVRGQ